jgi:hypothetical protein
MPNDYGPGPPPGLEVGHLDSTAAAAAAIRTGPCGQAFGGSFVRETGVRNSAYGADKFGFKDLAEVHWNHQEPVLYEHAIRNGEATLVEGGALCAETGVHTGRSPKDKHTVVDALTENTVWWDELPAAP